MLTNDYHYKIWIHLLYKKKYLFCHCQPFYGWHAVNPTNQQTEQSPVVTGGFPKSPSDIKCLLLFRSILSIQADPKGALVSMVSILARISSSPHLFSWYLCVSKGCNNNQCLCQLHVPKLYWSLSKFRNLSRISFNISLSYWKNKALKLTHHFGSIVILTFGQV